MHPVSGLAARRFRGNGVTPAHLDLNAGPMSPFSVPSSTYYPGGASAANTRGMKRLLFVSVMCITLIWFTEVHSSLEDTDTFEDPGTSIVVLRPDGEAMALRAGSTHRQQHPLRPRADLHHRPSEEVAHSQHHHPHPHPHPHHRQQQQRHPNRGDAAEPHAGGGGAHRRQQSAKVERIGEVAAAGGGEVLQQQQQQGGGGAAQSDPELFLTFSAQAAGGGGGAAAGGAAATSGDEASDDDADGEGLRDAAFPLLAGPVHPTSPAGSPFDLSEAEKEALLQGIRGGAASHLHSTNPSASLAVVYADHPGLPDGFQSLLDFLSSLLSSAALPEGLLGEALTSAAHPASTSNGQRTPLSRGDLAQLGTSSTEKDLVAKGLCFAHLLRGIPLRGNSTARQGRGGAAGGGGHRFPALYVYLSGGGTAGRGGAAGVDGNEGVLKSSLLGCFSGVVGALWGAVGRGGWGGPASLSHIPRHVVGLRWGAVRPSDPDHAIASYADISEDALNRALLPSPQTSLGENPDTGSGSPPAATHALLLSSMLHPEESPRRDTAETADAGATKKGGDRHQMNSNPTRFISQALSEVAEHPLDILGCRWSERGPHGGATVYHYGHAFGFDGQESVYLKHHLSGVAQGDARIASSLLVDLVSPLCMVIPATAVAAAGSGGGGGGGGGAAPPQIKIPLDSPQKHSLDLCEADGLVRAGESLLLSASYISDTIPLSGLAVASAFSRIGAASDKPPAAASASEDFPTVSYESAETLSAFLAERTAHLTLLKAYVAQLASKLRQEKRGGGAAAVGPDPSEEACPAALLELYDKSGRERHVRSADATLSDSITLAKGCVTTPELCQVDQALSDILNDIDAIFAKLIERLTSLMMHATHASAGVAPLELTRLLSFNLAIAAPRIRGEGSAIHPRFVSAPIPVACCSQAVLPQRTPFAGVNSTLFDLLGALYKTPGATISTSRSPFTEQAFLREFSEATSAGYFPPGSRLPQLSLSAATAYAVEPGRFTHHSGDSPQGADSLSSVFQASGGAQGGKTSLGEERVSDGEAKAVPLGPLRRFLPRGAHYKVGGVAKLRNTLHDGIQRRIRELDFLNQTKTTRFSSSLQVVWQGWCCRCCGFSNEWLHYLYPLERRVKLRATTGVDCHCSGFARDTIGVAERAYIPPGSGFAIPPGDVFAAISHTTPDSYRPTSTLHGGRAPDYFIGRSMYEFSLVPEKWVAHCNSHGVGEIWVPSEFMKTAFTNSGVDPAKLVVIPEAVDHHFYSKDVAEATPEFRALAAGGDAFPPVGWSHCSTWDGVAADGSGHGVGARGRPPGGPAPYSFFSMFKWEPRKGGENLLKSFFHEFWGDRSVRLVIATWLWYSAAPDLWGPTRDPAIFRLKLQEALRQAAEEASADPERQQQMRAGLSSPQCPEVVIVTESLTEGDVRALYALSDAFVLPTRGEGWGLPIVQAMAMGMPTLATDWGGTTAFLRNVSGAAPQANLPVSFPIKVVGVEPLPVEAAKLYDVVGMQWAVPDLLHLRELMRGVYTHREAASEIGRRARAFVSEQFSEEAVADIMHRRLLEIEQLVLRRRAAKHAHTARRPSTPK